MYTVHVQGLWMRVRLWRRRRVDFRVQNKTIIIFVQYTEYSTICV